MTHCSELLTKVVRDALVSSDDLKIPDYFDTVAALLRGSDEADNDDDGGVFEALEAALGFMRMAEFGVEPNHDDWQLLVQSIRALIAGLKDYDPIGDTSLARFRTLLAVTSYLDRADTLWSLLPNLIGNNIKLLMTSERLIQSQSFELRALSFAAPISTGRALDELKRADENSDWEALGELFPRLPPPITGYVAPQAIRCLARYDFQRLVDATSKIVQIVVAAMITEALGVEDVARLALATLSDRLKFTCMFRLFRGRRETLSNEAEELVVQMLVEISQNDALWRSWMQVFNRYPIRFPQLQRPLGKALAQANEAAIEQYVLSVELHARPHEERRLVANCLEAFYAASHPVNRLTLWAFAHQRWQEWDFDAKSPEAFLLEISWSALDFAVVGYFVQCTTDAEREDLASSLVSKLLDLRERGSPHSQGS